METNFNFKSQVCTSREQSERLLALGLKKETADMCWTKMAAIRGTFYVPELAPINMVSWRHTPAWSLHRLIEMMPNEVRNGGYLYELNINRTCIHYSRYKIEIEDYVDLEGFSSTDSLYDIIISMLEWLIEEGYFNKEYLNGNQDKI